MIYRAGLLLLYRMIWKLDVRSDPCTLDADCYTAEAYVSAACFESSSPICCFRSWRDGVSHSPFFFDCEPSTRLDRRVFDTVSTKDHHFEFIYKWWYTDDLYFDNFYYIYIYLFIPFKIRDTILPFGNYSMRDFDWCAESLSSAMSNLWSSHELSL